MIFVTVGSQKFQFNRLLQAVDELVQKGVIRDEVYAQTGVCTYVPRNYRAKAFLDRDEFQNIMEKSTIVITHGGTGTIVRAIKMKKKVIAVPRLKKYGEHVDNHQMQLIGQFTKHNLISSCSDLQQLEELLKTIEKKEYAVYHSNTEKYLEEIQKYIEEI